MDKILLYSPIFAVLFSVYVWWINRNQVGNERVTALDHRITVVEEALKNVPTHSDMEKLGEGMTSIGNEVREMKGEMKGMYRTVKLIEELLLRNGGNTS